MKFIAWALIFLLTAIAPAGAQQPPVYLSGGQLVDVVRGEVYPDVGVLCEDGKITGLFFDFAYNENRIPKNAVRIDVRGKYLIPGLTDLHVHAPMQYRGVPVDLKHFFKMFLAGGVTTVRAMTPGLDGLLHVKAEIDAGKADGPNIVVGSNPAIEQAPGFPRVERTTIVNNATEARQIVRDYAYKGADWIKFYNYGDKEIVGAVVDEAHRHGKKVFGHFTMLGAVEASRLGVDSLEHTVSLIQGALDYETSISMTDVGYYRSFILWPSVNEKKLDEMFKVLVANGTAIIPTLAIQSVVADEERMTKLSSSWFDLYQKELYQSFQKDTSRVPSVYNFAKVREQWRKSILVQAHQMARFVHMGGKIGTGSDLQPAPPLVPGLSMHQEMEALASGGLTPLEALRASTIGAAQILGWEQRLGSIEVGKQADIAVIDGNPLADIRAVGNIDIVIQGGRVHKIAELKNELRGGR